MRILQVRFKNLNSLVGEWKIDLTHPDYVSDGIFAIIGPTGAGKSTILDAVCLALYGRTPRLNRITKSGNGIMSRQTGECFAEVTFDTRQGRFRCHWSQHRARRHPDGELQAPKHEIVDADSGEILESRIKGVADRIEAACGMDFDRFTRSMLLAQGGFAAFLQSAPDERAPILEQITGTEIYSSISIRVHERFREEREKLNRLEADAGTIAVLEPEMECALQQEISVAQQEEAVLKARIEETKNAIAWLGGIAQLKAEIEGIAAEGDQLQREMEVFSARQRQLDLALQAQDLEGQYATLIALRVQQKTDENARTDAEARLCEREVMVQQQTEVVTSATAAREAAAAGQEADAPILRKVRLLDEQIADLNARVTKAQASCDRDATQIEAKSDVLQQAQQNRNDVEQQLNRIAEWIRVHARDEWLVGGLAGVEEQLNTLASRQNDIREAEFALSRTGTALEQIRLTYHECDRECGACSRDLQTAEERRAHRRSDLETLLAGRLLREFRAEKDHLLQEMAFLARITELEDYRVRLEDGAPCALCGATEHPYARGNVPVLDEHGQKIEGLTARIESAESLEAEIQTLDASVAMIRTLRMDAENRKVLVEADLRVTEGRISEFEDGLRRQRSEFETQKQVVGNRLAPLGIPEIPDAEVSLLLDALTERRDRWQAKMQQKGCIQTQLGDIDSEIMRLSAIVDTLNGTLVENRQQLVELTSLYATRCAERTALYGERQPDAEERCQRQVLQAAGEVEQTARDRLTEQQQQRHTTSARVDSLKQGIEQRQPELESREREFVDAMKSTTFSAESEFLEARLPLVQREALVRVSRKLNERQMDLRSRQTDRDTRLATQIAMAVTDRVLTELKPQWEEDATVLTALRETLYGLRRRLDENTAARERIIENRAAIAAQKTEYRRWDALHELIGSADGKKYRNFAQGLTFEMMIGHANQQLQKMTDRYLLLRDDHQPLELNVIDTFQAGVIRSTRNLSGGESFIVSLSLALGLSRMASRKVRVDSLFLDEGFGTLDEEALETALETLSGLQQDGKVIGVISHVPALRERIRTQIRIIPQTGGRSRISGPGCSSL